MSIQFQTTKSSFLHNHEGSYLNSKLTPQKIAAISMSYYATSYILEEHKNFIITFFLWVMAPQFSQAPFLYLVAVLLVSTPRLYHSVIPE